MLLDWREFHAARRVRPEVVEPQRRLRLLLAGFLVLFGVVLIRVVQLEVTQGDAFRAEAARPMERLQSLPGIRGRILSRNGAVLAYDKKVLGLAVHYRYLEDPPDRHWLRTVARLRLSRSQRRNRQQVAEAEARLAADLAELRGRLAAMCGLSEEQWRRRAKQIQARVEQIAETVNRRLTDGPWKAVSAPAFDSWWDRIRVGIVECLRASMGPTAPERITVAEQRDYHLMAEDVPLAVAAEGTSSAMRW